MKSEEDAWSVAAALRDYGERNQDASCRILGNWALALIDLQRGLAAATADRKALFHSAAERMCNLFAEVFGWNPKNVGVRAVAGLDEGSIAFYTAKSLWCLRMTWPHEDTAQSETYRVLQGADEDGIPHPALATMLGRALDCALSRYEKVRASSSLDDQYIVAIYNFCVGLLLCVRWSVEELNTYNFRQLTKDYPDITIKEDARAHALRCLATARTTSVALQDRLLNQPDEIPGGIYTEAYEKISSFNSFNGDVDLVFLALTKPELIYEYYSGAKSIGALLKQESAHV